ncbi:aminodeoxychorismate lyase [Vibrio sp. 10N.286.49.C2]|uniref:aminodeoxychorismate lyase n=1 Tax=unclassified Vibrio TaxID=2614977 RepID=UPI000C81E8D9|nr:MULTISPECIES: aminodeoxychorismate lyase [unclassified Vibrio]PMH33746.1 aminodeoxychorismate lyase [Vibrio sp. 10N.286.49.C2]PMH44003.1 aminodeoxychorismate lyase [Vibrio sp. 10N.286.49.B1]PMH78739.1 aminodeoxychorismate lyase [Vibrio sp. 10N.286.48.B7]
MFWRDGQLIDNVSVRDRSFQYGDGCFTTILTKCGNLELWPQHIARMNTALDTLQIPHPDWSAVHDNLSSIALKAPLAGLKVHVSRGEGGRGYSTLVGDGPITTISRFDYPSHYGLLKSRGLSLMLCDTRLGLNPLLAGIKHNNRLEQVLVKAEIEKTNFDDGLALDLNGNVIETSMANVFWVHRGAVYTPSLVYSGVAGVMREQIIKALEVLGITLHIGEFPVTSIMTAEEIFVSNCILGVAPVNRIQEASLPIGSITRRIQENLGQC